MKTSIVRRKEADRKEKRLKRKAKGKRKKR
jgi:hypothetical protein